MPQDLYAYTLRNQEPGWAWHVYDIDGDLIASGLAVSQAAAAAAVNAVMKPEAAERPGFAVSSAASHSAP